MDIKFQIIFISLCALCVFVVSGSKDEHKENHRFHEKSHQNKHRNEKSHRSLSHTLGRHQKTETRNHGSSPLKSFSYRNGNRDCRFVCTNGASSNASLIRVFYNGDAGIIALLNESAHVADIRDYTSNILASLNGQTGSALVADRSKNKFYTIDKTAETEKILWISSKSDFLTYFKSLSSLQNIAKLAQEQGKSKNIDDVQEITKQETPYLTPFGITPSENNYAESKQLISEWNTTLKFLYKGQGSFVIHKSGDWFFKLNLAFADIFRDSQNDPQLANVKLDLSSVFGASSGVEALLNLLTQIGGHVDLAKVLGDRLNSPEKLLELLEKVSGGSNEGLDGIITVVITVLRAISGHCSVSQAITVILDYEPEAEGESSSLTKVINQALQLIQTQNKMFNNSAAFRRIASVLKAINDHNLVYNNVDISDIITLLASRNPRTMIQVIIRICSRFISMQGFPQFIRNFVMTFTNGNASSFISRLFPGIDLSALRNATDVSGITSALSHIPVIGRFFNSSEVTSILSHFPVIGNFFPHGSSDGFNVSNFFNSNPFVEGFQGMIQNGSLPDFGSASSGIEGVIQNIGGIFGSLGENSATQSSTTSSTLSSTATSSTTSESSDIKPVSSTEGGTITTSSTNSASTKTTTGSSASSADTEESTSSSESSEEESSTAASATATESVTVASSTASTSKDTVLRHGKIHTLQEKELKHQHGHSMSNRKENWHEKHTFHEKEAHGHSESLNRKQDSHLRQKLQDKEHNGHSKASHRHEIPQFRHEIYGKDISARKHSRLSQEKKHDHHNQNH